MDAKLKKRWIAALRSGRYKQGRGFLKTGATRCCLGVLADIKGVVWRKNQPYFKGEAVGLYAEEQGLLSPAFCGISKETQLTLADLNDGPRFPGTVTRDKPWSFKQIADYIEKRLK